MNRPMTLVETLQYLTQRDKEIAQTILPVFTKPVEDITEQDIRSTLSPAGLSALRNYAMRLYEKQLVAAKRDRKWRHGGRP